jgi:hypothetical protein
VRDRANQSSGFKDRAMRSSSAAFRPAVNEGVSGRFSGPPLSVSISDNFSRSLSTAFHEVPGSLLDVMFYLNRQFLNPLCENHSKPVGAYWRSRQNPSSV